MVFGARPPLNVLAPGISMASVQNTQHFKKTKWSSPRKSSLSAAKFCSKSVHFTGFSIHVIAVVSSEQNVAQIMENWGSVFSERPEAVKCSNFLGGHFVFLKCCVFCTEAIEMPGANTFSALLFVVLFRLATMHECMHACEDQMIERKIIYYCLFREKPQRMLKRP